MNFKKISKLVAVGIVGVTLTGVLTGCSDDDSDSSSSTEVSQSHKKKKLTKKQRIDKEVKRGQKIYKDEAKVAYNKDWNAITITPTSKDFTEAVTTLINNGEGESQDWKDLTNSLKELSNTVIQNTEVANISVALVNPNNPDKVLYTARNGKTTYDLAKDQNR